MQVRGLQRGEKVTSAEDEDSDAVVRKLRKQSPEAISRATSPKHIRTWGAWRKGAITLPTCSRTYRALESVFLSYPLLTQAVTRRRRFCRAASSVKSVRSLRPNSHKATARPFCGFAFWCLHLKETRLTYYRLRKH
jgi:hypothetical protein